MRVPPSTRELLAGLDRGERRALARLLTLVEDGSPARLREVVAALHPRTGRARVLGVTGPPGVGKSTLTNLVATALRRRDRRVAVVAVDPSSPFTGGALLGDRVRMQGHHADPGVFIRSMASRGHLGGLSFAVPHAVLVLDAAGFDDVLVETVGVGQSEVEIAGTADTTLVVLAPGMGDGIQAAKAGILEIADVFVVNKADQAGSGALVAELQGMVELGASPPGGAGGWSPRVVVSVAVRGEGIAAVLDAVEAHGTAARASGTATSRRLARARQFVREIALARVQDPGPGGDGDALLDSLARAVAERRLDPYVAADELFDALRAGEPRARGR